MFQSVGHDELMAEHNQAAHDLAKRLVEHLAEDPAYEAYGELEQSPWGAGQWLRFTDVDGGEHFPEWWLSCTIRSAEHADALHLQHLKSSRPDSHACSPRSN
jgi:hypothetical protein